MSTPKRTFHIIFALLVILSLACSLPGLGGGTPTPRSGPGTALAPTAIPTATPPPMPLPPALLETDPLPGSELSLDGAITFYFNQAMDHASVEGAFSGEPLLSGSFNWLSDSTVAFKPDTPLQPASSLAINIASTAQSQRGMAMLNPVQVDYNTAGYLQVTQTLPYANSAEIDPTSAVVATFNRPVVDLGGVTAALPEGFTLQPSAPGHGEWINTSTYIFYPQPALAGSTTYTAQVNPLLTGVSGSPLEFATAWSFTTSAPRLVSAEPADGTTTAPIDSAVKLTFNQVMDPASVEANFTLATQNGQPVAGQFAWDEAFNTLTFTPTALLQRGAMYQVTLGAGAAALGGTILGGDQVSSWYTVPELAVIGSSPEAGGVSRTWESVRFYVTSIIASDQVLPYVTVDPPITNLYASMDPTQMQIYLNGDFLPETEYTITLLPGLADRWGDTLGQAYTLRFSTASLEPSLSFPYGTDANFLTTQDSGVVAMMTNLDSLPMSVGTLPLADFINMLAPTGYDLRHGYQPADARFWEFKPELTPNVNQAVTIPLSPEGGSMPPGLYHVRFNLAGNNYYAGPLLVAVSNYHTTLKLSANEAFVWAVGLRSNTPAAGLPVSIYDEGGALVAQGTTDAEGIFRAAIPTQSNPYAMVYAILGQPGNADFGLAVSTWSEAIGPWEFNLPSGGHLPATQAYVYTDRPIYRPGQTVYFRAVVRQAYNGRYSLPDLASYPLVLNDSNDQVLATYDLPLSAFGSGYGEYTLPEDAQPGFYRLVNNADSVWLQFQVADYRKPEINIGVYFQAGEIMSGQSLLANVNARYFFDAPASNVAVHWALYEKQAGFSIPGGYTVGPYDSDWLQFFAYPFGDDALGELVVSGDTRTDANGLLTLELPTAQQTSRRQYTLEVTITDESGLPTSGRAAAYTNPSDIYLGIRPDAWSGQAGQPLGYEVLAVNWAGDPAPDRPLTGIFQQVTWVQKNEPDFSMNSMPEFEAVYTAIASTDFVSGADGKARLSFTPPNPGTYLLTVQNASTASQVLIWVGGTGAVTWPNLPNQRLHLTANLDAYQPGDTAQIFIPNPFSAPALALVTFERSTVMRYRVETIQPGGSSLSFDLGDEDAPNVYAAVTLLGQDAEGRADFRQGYLNLMVKPVQQTLNVALTSQPQRSGPGDNVTFNILVTDAAGSPVQGEFSVSVVDLAVLALADPNAPDILTAFYGQQPLGVRTGLSLAVSGQRLRYMVGGMGGGGDMQTGPLVRENFPDTAYWNAQVLTDANGQAAISLDLPDSLTTWQVVVRGLTADARVGEATLQLVTSKELLVRPVAPRFLVAGDHALLAAVVQNNTRSDLQVDVMLQAGGFELDDINTLTQHVNVPAGGRTRVEWWGTAQDVGSADLTFWAESGDLQDAVRLAGGALPVLRYTTPQTFATSGVMDEAGEQLELVSLPATFDANAGDLRIELAPSLAAGMLDGLAALEENHCECTEEILSRFLPNLETYRILQSFGIESPDLQARLERTLRSGLDQLLARQNPDGGWSWAPVATDAVVSVNSDPYLTAYMVFGLTRTAQAGVNFSPEALQRGVEFLTAASTSPDQVTDPGALDRLTFQYFALGRAGAANPSAAGQLYERRSELSPWAQAFLALLLEDASPGSQQADTLLTDLQATALRSATGAHWETSAGHWWNWHTPLSGSAVVIYALAQRQPAAAVLPEAVNYLMSNRNPNGGWGSSFESAWTLLALAEVMRGTGELSGYFGFSAILNGIQVASGQAGGETQLNPVVTLIPVTGLYPHDPNALAIQRDPGSGRLYYNAALTVYRPVETIAPLNRGLQVWRSYYADGDDPLTAAPIVSAQAGQAVTVRLTLVLPNDAYNLRVEDYIPAGAEILDTRLNTVQVGESGLPGPLYDPGNPFGRGWGWWMFSPARIYDNHIAWSAGYLPAGTYELTYTLVLLHPGQYHVLPVQAWMAYFPEVQGASAGATFEVKP